MSGLVRTTTYRNLSELVRPPALDLSKATGSAAELTEVVRSRIGSFSSSVEGRGPATEAGDFGECVSFCTEESSGAFEGGDCLRSLSPDDDCLMDCEEDHFDWEAAKKKVLMLSPDSDCKAQSSGSSTPIAGVLSAVKGRFVDGTSFAVH